ncbi:uncharacterized protein LOC127736433 [Mytilus californianus]|uniref:uncharacterized protein LOC127736433 n=1 Tax=Mytilus californianus TaxID=6549 RepID=UPI002245DEFB|nr:uncharacterized protein LOC127736433 [Mytilus californianus]
MELFTDSSGSAFGGCASNAYYIKQKLYCGCNFSSTVGTVSSHVSRGSTRTRKGPTVFSTSDLKFESNKLLTASISPNTSDTYETAVRSFDQFRSSHGHAIVWPPSLNGICNFIAYLSVRGYAPSTVKSYIFGIAIKCKMLNITDNTQNFIIKKMLIGMERLDKRADSRLPITPQILDKLISLLPSVCLSQYETLLFSGLFSLAYFGFFRIGELVVNKSLAHYHTLSLDDFRFLENNVSINLKFSKTDQLGKGSLIIIPSINSHNLNTRLIVTLRLSGQQKSVWLVGSSIIKHAFVHARRSVDGVNLGLERIKTTIWWQGKSGMRICEIIPKVKHLLTFEEPPQVLVFHCGGNDIGQKVSCVLGHDILKVIDCLRVLLPQSKFV